MGFTVRLACGESAFIGLPLCLREVDIYLKYLLWYWMYCKMYYISSYWTGIWGVKLVDNLCDFFDTMAISQIYFLEGKELQSKELDTYSLTPFILLPLRI